MKKSTFVSLIIILIVLCICLCSCGIRQEISDVWQDAMYTSDTELGTGRKTVLVEVIVSDKSLTFTLHTDKETLGEALSEHDLIQGEKGAYGLYVKKVNGMTADYDADKTYWALTKDGESLLTGVDATMIRDGEHYEIVHTK